MGSEYMRTSRTGALADARATAPFVRATLDRQIDNLVYDIYDLTPEEIAIVEGAQK